jgi:hypothetical protein
VASSGAKRINLAAMESGHLRVACSPVGRIPGWQGRPFGAHAKGIDMRRTAMTGALALASMIAVSVPAAGGPDRTELCHYDSYAGEYVLLSLPSKAHEAHASNHAEDIAPDSSGGCAQQQPPVLLARAFTTMSDGTERLISQLVDVDESGTITAGDVVEVNGFPASFDPDPDVVPVQVSQHVIPVGASVDQFSSGRVWVSWTYTEDSRTVYEAFRFVSTPQTQWFMEVINPDFPNTNATVSAVTDGFGINADRIELRTVTPSHPQSDLLLGGPVGSNTVDNDFIDVEIYMPAL